MNSKVYQILATGNSAAYPVGGGNLTLGVRGNFNGSAHKFQWCEKPSTTDADWFDVLKADGSALTFTAQGQTQVTVGTGYLRDVVTIANPTCEIVIAGAFGDVNKPT